MDFEDINTCYPAKIVSYDPATQMATCKIQVEDYYVGIGYSYRKQEAPLLVDVPVMIPQAGGWMLTFPVKEGDDCLVLYAQKGYDQWLYSGASETGLIGGRPTAEHYRAYDNRDAICIVGLRPVPRAIPNYNPDDMELRNESLTHRMTFKANGDIEVHTDTDVNITAQNTTITSPNVKVKSDLVTVDAPMTKFTGSIQVGGNIGMGGAGRSNVCMLDGLIKVTGTGTFDGEVTAKGKTVSAHTHTDAEGRPTSTPN